MSLFLMVQKELYRHLFPTMVQVMIVSMYLWNMRLLAQLGYFLMTPSWL